MCVSVYACMRVCLYVMSRASCVGVGHFVCLYVCMCVWYLLLCSRVYVCMCVCDISGSVRVCVRVCAYVCV